MKTCMLWCSSTFEEDAVEMKVAASVVHPFSLRQVAVISPECYQVLSTPSRASPANPVDDSTLCLQRPHCASVKLAGHASLSALQWACLLGSASQSTCRSYCKAFTVRAGVRRYASLPRNNLVSPLSFKSDTF
jgi:hypothetical protein